MGSLDALIFSGSTIMTDSTRMCGLFAGGGQ